jgi:hypothetical protein
MSLKNNAKEAWFRRSAKKWPPDAECINDVFQKEQSPKAHVELMHCFLIAYTQLSSGDKKEDARTCMKKAYP